MDLVVRPPTEVGEGLDELAHEWGKEILINFEEFVVLILSSFGGLILLSLVERLLKATIDIYSNGNYNWFHFDIHFTDVHVTPFCSWSLYIPS